MAIKDKTTLNTELDSIVQPGVPGGIRATSLNNITSDQIDSTLNILEDSPTVAFSEVLTFDDKRTKFIEHQLAGDLSFSLAPSGNLAGAVIVLTLLPDGVSSIQFTNDFVDINNPSTVTGNPFADFNNNNYNKLFMYYDPTQGKVFVNIKSTFVDTTGPTILSGVMAANNTYIDVNISDGVYGSNNGIDPVLLADFDVIFTQGGGSATAWTPTTATKIDGNPLVGGETIIRINGTVTGTPDGNETLEVTPINDTSIYNWEGFAMVGTETTGAVNLTDESTIIFMQDDFAGTVIDLSKWVITNPNSSDLEIAQNEQLEFNQITTAAHSADLNNVTSIASITSGALAADLTKTAANTYPGFRLQIDPDNYVGVTRSTGDPANAYLNIQQGGSSVYALTDSLIPWNNKWKLVIESNDDIKFYYWNVSTWTQVGVTQNFNIGTNKKAYITTNSTAADIGDDMKVDNLYLTNQDYLTETPL